MKTTERHYYVYILYWYNPYPNAEIRERDDGEQYAVCLRENGEADPTVMVSKQHLMDIVKARTGSDEWEVIQPNRLWRLGNYWIKRDILGFNLNLEEMEYKEYWREDIGKDRYRMWPKKDDE